MTVLIRPITSEELPAYIETMSASFLERPPQPQVAEEVRPLWDLGRAWAAFDGDRMAATLRSWVTEITVPGGRQVSASAITNVTVLPTHRRRGILRGLVAAEHLAIRERGEAVGLLYASEYPIYGRFGYGPGASIATWTLDTRRTRFRGEPIGGVELVKPDASSRDALKAVYDAWRTWCHGEPPSRGSAQGSGGLPHTADA
jgi:predicted acetyltransferase